LIGVVPSSKKSGVTWMGAKPSQGPSLSLAIFGKHPGWDDHIDDLGLDTPRLVDVKRTLYLDALAGNIDSGAWEKLEVAQLLPAFGHELVWFSPAGLVVGRLWASRDGKGRTKYPMFVVAECEGVSAAGLTDVVMPRLEEVERLCSATTSAEDVRRILDEARNELREAIKASAGDTGPAGVRGLSAISDSPAMGPGRVGLHRVLYEIQREQGVPLSKSERKSVTRMGDGPALHLRVPACAAGTFESARLWAGLLNVRTDRVTQVLAIRANGTDYSDLIVGGVTASVLFCLRASIKGLPLASDVPYTMEEAFVAQCEATVEAWRDGRAQPEDHKPAPPTGGGVPSAPATDAGAGSDADRNASAPKRWFKGWLGMGAVAAGVAAVAGAGYVLTRDNVPANASTNTLPAANAKPSASQTAPLSAAQPVVQPTPSTTPQSENKADDETRAAAKAQAETLAKKQAQDVLDAQARASVQAKAIAEAEREKREESERQAKATAAKESVAKNAAVKEAEAKEVAAKEAATKETAAKELAAKETAAKEIAAKERETKLAEASNAAAERKAALDAITADTARIMDLFDHGYGPTETASGTTVRALADQLSSKPLYSSIKDSDQMKSVTARLAAFEAIGKTGDAPSLVKQATAAAPLAESLAAWDRLAAGAGLAWPANDADLGAAAQALVTLKAASNRVKDGARAAELSARIEDRARAIWSRGLASAVRSGNAEAVGAACGRMAALGVTKESAISSADRYNVLLWEFKRDLAALGDIAADDAGKVAALKQRADRFASDSGALPGDVLKKAGPAAGASALAASLTALSAPPSKQAAAPGPMGPALRGWASTAKVVDAISRMVFTPPGGGAAMEFVLVDAPTGPVYLATTEFSVGEFIAAVESSGKWAEFDELMMKPAPGKADQRAGARTWVWSPATSSTRSKMRSSVAGTGDTGAGWLAPSATMQGQASYAGKPPEPPTLGSPMAQVTVPAAAYVATLLGCRLPTSDEWLAAAGDARLTNSSTNYRDAAWKRQVDFVRGISVNRRAEYPDAGVYWPPGVKKVLMTSARPVSQDDDETIWFAPANSGDGVLKNLLGNVAEFCVNDARVFSGESSGKEIQSALGKGESARILGASALSPPEVDPKTPYALEPGLFGKLMFSDVGFRLAFSPSAGVLAAAKPVVVKGSELASGLSYAMPE